MLVATITTSMFYFYLFYEFYPFACVMLCQVICEKYIRAPKCDILIVLAMEYGRDINVTHLILAVACIIGNIISYKRCIYSTFICAFCLC